MEVLHRTKSGKKGGKDMSTVMDVEENFVPVNSREDIEKVMINSGDKKKLKYFRKLFRFLGGGDSPVEAIELALGRDTSLKETQLTVLSIFSLWVDEINCQTVAGHNERKMLINFLSDCNIVKLIIRLITLKPAESKGKELFSKYLYYHCINILAHVTNKRYIENGLERVRNMKIIRAYHAVPRLVEFLDPLNNDPLIIYQTSIVLKHLAKDKRDMCIQIHKADGLRRCLHFMLRKEADKMFADYLKENFSSKLSMPSEEVEILEKFYTGKRYVLKKTERYPQKSGVDQRRDCFTYMSAELQENCALIVFEIVSNPKISKSEILKLKSFIKVLNKWFTTACIWRPERTMLQGCFHLLRGVLNDEKPALTADEFLKNYDILDLLKQHMYNPDSEVLSSVLMLLSELSTQYPEFRKKFIASPVYSKLLPVYLQSFDSQVQIWALQTLITFVQSKSAAKHVLSIGVTAEKLYLLTEYNSFPTNELIKSLKSEMEKYCPSEWKTSEKIFQNDMLPQKYNLERAQKYKEEGNSRFKLEEFESALKCYTLGLESVPPVEHFTLSTSNSRDSNFRPWYVLPSVLFTNRAQCYLSMKKWVEAIDDCTEAIVRSYEDNDEAKKILFKTVYRRARAFSELKNYRNALNDISFCLRFNPAATNIRLFFRETLTAYRKEVGMESLRRCGTCMEGVGMKLKRCARCPEMYCSRECQTYAWEEEGHKQFCNYTLDESNCEESNNDDGKKMN